METGRLIGFDFWQEYPEAPEYFKFLEEYIDSLTSETPTDNLPEILKSYQHLEFSIKIRGVNWNDDYVDATIAKYVLAMQESLNDILENYEIPQNTILVTVKIEKGCKKIIANLEGLINSLRNFYSNMSGREKLILSLICLLGFSAWVGLPAYKEYMIAKQEAKRDVLTQKGLTDTIRESLKTIDNAIEALKEVTENKSLYDKPYRIIEKSLEDTDSVAINNDSNFISKNRFAETLKSKRNPKREFENKYLDGEFHIVDIYADKEIIKLSIDEKTLYVDFSELSKADKATLLSKIANDGDLSSNLVRLQINVNCNEYRIKESKLHGFGEPREDAVSVSDIPIK